MTTTPLFIRNGAAIRNALYGIAQAYRKLADELVKGDAEQLMLVTDPPPYLDAEQVTNYSLMFSQRADKIEAPHFANEFPDFDYDIRPYIAELPAGWSDCSWHNDACPKACLDGAEVSLFFDYESVELSETAESRLDGSLGRFSLSTDEGDTLLATDDWPLMREFITSREFLK
jgi:hypothetical protein